MFILLYLGKNVNPVDQNFMFSAVNCFAISYLADCKYLSGIFKANIMLTRYYFRDYIEWLKTLFSKIIYVKWHIKPPLLRFSKYSSVLE